MKHNYTNEMELKSILIRIQVARKIGNTVKSNKTIINDTKEIVMNNKKISKYIKWYSKIQKMNFDDKKKVRKVQNDLKELIIKKSEVTPIDSKNYERFGHIIMQMVTHILTKAQFRGYSYYDDFMSDSVYKILKYLDNFDHTLISERSGQQVKAFAYISQIIQNAIIYVITKRKKEQDFIKEQVNNQRIALGLPSYDLDLDSKKQENKEKVVKVKCNNEILIKKIFDTIEENKEFIKNKQNKLVIEYKNDNLEIDDLSSLQSIKKTYKNVKVNYIKE